MSSMLIFHSKHSNQLTLPAFLSAIQTDDANSVNAVGVKQVHGETHIIDSQVY